MEVGQVGHWLELGRGLQAPIPVPRVRSPCHICGQMVTFLSVGLRGGLRFTFCTSSTHVCGVSVLPHLLELDSVEGPCAASSRV